MSGPHVFVASVEAPVLATEDHHHLARVLRLKPGEGLTVSDGAGRWRDCRFGDELEPTGDVHEVAPSLPRLTVAFALVKGGRPELITQKLTELGIDDIVPFVAERSVVRWDEERAHRNHERLERVAREAAMQSRRCWLPTVAPVERFDVTVARVGAVLADPGGGPLEADHATILVGPEGGWTDAERAAGGARVRLGPHVLRSETAAIAAGVLLGVRRVGA